MRESGEDYLETIYLLGKKNAGVHAIDVANELSFSKPSVTKALRILKENGYINIDEFNHIILTKAGKQKAQEIYERHQIITKFWIINGVSAETAAKDACRMEHHISEETFLKIKELAEKEAITK